MGMNTVPPDQLRRDAENLRNRALSRPEHAVLLIIEATALETQAAMLEEIRSMKRDLSNQLQHLKT